MAHLDSVLLIDPDAQGLATLTFGFSRDGCRTRSFVSYGEAAQQAAAEPFDAVVLALRPEAAACREILEGLAERDGRPMPVVVLGAEEHRQLVDAMPGADFLPLPAYIRDILTTARLRAGITRADGREPVLHGTLSEFGVLSLLRSLQATRRSAIVTLDRPTRRGELRFARGELTWAQVGSQQGTAAINQLLLWEEAALEVQLRDVVVRRSQFTHQGAELLAEIERFLRDFVAAARPLGSARTVLAATPAATGASSELVTPEVAPVLRLCDGQRSLAEVIDESPFRVFDTLKVVQRFVEHGLLQSTGEPPAPTRGSLRSPLLEDWLRPRGDDEYVQTGTSTAAAESARERVRLPTPPPVAAAEARAARRAQRKSTQRVKTLRAQTGGKPATKPGSAEAGQSGALAPRRDQAGAGPASNAGAAVPSGRPPGPALDEGPTTPAAASPATAAADASPDGRRRARTGELLVGGEVNARPQQDRALAARPSIVIDLPLEEVRPGEPALPEAQLCAPPASAPPAERERHETPAFGMPAPRRDRPVLKVAARPAGPAAPVTPAAAPPSPPPEPITPSPVVARATGSIVVASAPRRSQTPHPAAAGGLASIQLAPELLGAVVAAAPASDAVIPGVPSPASLARAAITPAPDAAPTSTALAPQPAVNPAPGGAGRPRASSPAPARARRPSNEFNAVERDFFAREADLYKQEPTDDFADLDGTGRRRR